MCKSANDHADTPKESSAVMPVNQQPAKTVRGKIQIAVGIIVCGLLLFSVACQMYSVYAEHKITSDRDLLLIRLQPRSVSSPSGVLGGTLRISRFWSHKPAALSGVCKPQETEDSNSDVWHLHCVLCKYGGHEYHWVDIRRASAGIDRRCVDCQDHFVATQISY